MTLIWNGASIKLSRNKRNAVIRDKYGCFIGMLDIYDLIAELRLLRKNGNGVIRLIEIEGFFPPRMTKQQTLTTEPPNSGFRKR